MSPPPPSSTLFPYTTLFRSVRHTAVTPHAFAVQGLTEALNRIVTGNVDPGLTSAAMLLRSYADELDRKSTRLNSSHGYISYAVFCLKKKNSLPLHLPPPTRA